MKRETMIEKANALNAANVQNADVLKALQVRIADTLQTDNVASHCYTLAYAISQCASVALDNSQAIATRNAYALDKCALLMRAIERASLAVATSSKESAIFANYVLSVLRNLKRRKARVMSNEEVSATICAAIESDKMRASDVRLHKAASTASTQRSSTSYALHALQVCDYDRSAQTLTLRDSEQASAIMKLL